MSVLIKDIEIPSETSGVEIFMYNDGRALCRNLGEDRWVEVEAVPIPEHGRLGDLDEAEKAIKARYDSIDRKENGDWLSHDDAMFCNGLIRALQSVKNIPTIVEATKC